MTKQYWAIVDRDQRRVAWLDEKVCCGTEAVAAYLSHEPLESVKEVDSRNAVAVPLGTRKKDAKAKFSEVQAKHKEEFAKHRAATRAATQDVESMILEVLSKHAERYRERLSAFTKRVRDLSPSHAIAWDATQLIQAEVYAQLAGRIIGLVDRADAQDGNHSQPGKRNPVKVLRWVVDEIKEGLIQNRYQDTAAGIFHQPVGTARTKAMSDWVTNFEIKALLWDADARDKAREELGIAPVDYEAPWEPSTE